jgi:hypothetical protein
VGLVIQTLGVYSHDGQIGTITLDDDGELSGDNAATQSIVDARLDAHEDPQDAYDSINGMNNGYVWATDDLEHGGDPWAETAEAGG